MSLTDTQQAKDRRHVYDAALGPASDLENFFASSKLVTASGFFRVPELYDTLATRVLPEMIDRGRLSIWSAGCSDGREPYSIAMLLKSLAENEFELDLRASDINPGVISTAIQGEYQLTIPEVQALQEYPQFYHSLDSNHIRIRSELRSSIDFILEDLTTYTPEENFDLIFCTNVLFYYESDYRREIVRGLVEKLKADGVIYLEAVGNRFLQSVGLHKVKSGSHFYRRTTETE